MADGAAPNPFHVDRKPASLERIRSTFVSITVIRGHKRAHAHLCQSPLRFNLPLHIFEMKLLTTKIIRLRSGARRRRRRSPGRAGINSASLKVTPNNRGISLKAAVAQTNAAWICVGESEPFIFWVLSIRKSWRQTPAGRPCSQRGRGARRAGKQAANEVNTASLKPAYKMAADILWVLPTWRLK